jgi:hypothetical protein
VKIGDGTASARRIVLPHAGQTGVPRWGEVGSGSWVCGIACEHKQKVIHTNNTARAAEFQVKLGHCGFQIRTKGSELGHYPRNGRAHLTSGRSPDWLKMENADAPAVKREEEEEWGKKKGR